MTICKSDSTRTWSSSTYVAKLMSPLDSLLPIQLDQTSCDGFVGGYRRAVQ